MTNQENAASMSIGKLPALSMDARFNERCDDLDIFVCDRAALQAMLDDAPCQYSQGFLAGVMTFREQLSIITGRNFNS